MEKGDIGSQGPQQNVVLEEENEKKNKTTTILHAP
jgi:hypothetical protein